MPITLKPNAVKYKDPVTGNYVNVDVMGEKITYDAEAYAKGTKDGVAVSSTDPAYHNNSKYYAEQAQEILNSIPQDYSSLASDVSFLREDLDAEVARAEAEEARIEALFTQPVEEAVSDWLDDHPEATTTVQDGSLTEAKFADSLKLKVIKDYVTPEMFGAKGDGETNDYQAFRDCADYSYINKKKIYLPSKKYAVTGDNPLGVPYSFTESGGRLTYCMNVDGGESVIYWTPSESTDRFIHGQHMRNSIVQNLRVVNVAESPSGSFLSTKTSDGLSHTFSHNTFINCYGENFLYGFNFDSTGANATHDDLSVFINVVMAVNVFYYTTNGNSVNHNFYGCSWSDTSTGGSFVFIDTTSWAGGLNCYGCHFTTANNDTIIKSTGTHKRTIQLNGCRWEVYGTGVKLLDVKGGTIIIEGLESIILTDDITHAYISAGIEYTYGNRANIVVSNSKIPSDLVIVGYAAKVKFYNTLFLTGRTASDAKTGVSIDRINSKNIKRGSLYFETCSNGENESFYGTFQNDSLIKKVLELSSNNPAGTQQIVNRNTVYYCPYDIVADFTYLHEQAISQSNPEFAVLVNGVQKALVGIDATASNISISKGDAVTFRFYKASDYDNNIPESGLGVTSSSMKVEYLCK